MKRKNEASTKKETGDWCCGEEDERDPLDAPVRLLACVSHDSRM